jgi:putative sterol carrier protein
MTSVADAVQAMKAKFNPAAAAGLDLVFGFRIDDTKNFSLVVKDSTCELKEGENPDAQVTLVMDGETLKASSAAKPTACKRSWAANCALKAT